MLQHPGPPVPTLPQFLQIKSAEMEGGGGEAGAPSGSQRVKNSHHLPTWGTLCSAKLPRRAHVAALLCQGRACDRQS